MEDGKVWNYTSNENDKLQENIKKKGKSFIYTNHEMAKHLISISDIQKGDIVIEPGKGDGAFYNNIPTDCSAVWCEINEGRDFFEYDETKLVDVCLSNPPFVPRKLFWNFMEKSMRITKRKIYWLLNLSSLNVFTPRRIDIMKEQGWFIQSFHIVADKRWFGRYTWVEIGREDKGIFTCHRKTF